MPKIISYKIPICSLEIRSSGRTYIIVKIDGKNYYSLCISNNDLNIGFTNLNKTVTKYLIKKGVDVKIGKSRGYYINKIYFDDKTNIIQNTSYRIFQFF